MPLPLLALALPSIISGVGSIFSGLSRRKAAKKAGTAMADAGEVAKRDIFGASRTADVTLEEAARRAEETLGASGKSAAEGMYAGTDLANRGLEPYRQAGEQGNASLAELAKQGFKFNYEDYKNDPAFDFQLNKGTQAIGNSAAARGLASSGNVLQGLTDYGQGLASTYYENAFQRALKTFGANVEVNDILAGRGERTTSEYGRNVIGAGRYAGDVGMRTGENISDVITGTAGKRAAVVTGAAREAGPYTTGIGEATAAGTLGASAGTREMIAGGTNTLAALIAGIRRKRGTPQVEVDLPGEN